MKTYLVHIVNRHDPVKIQAASYKTDGLDIVFLTKAVPDAPAGENEVARFRKDHIIGITKEG